MAQAMLAAQLGGKKEIDMGKYNRMKKMGLPLASILNKMRLDGVSEDIVSQWGGGGPQQQENKEPEARIMEIAPTTKMKALHWAKLGQSQVDGTVWEGVDKAIKLYKVDYEELESLFKQINSGAAQQINSRRKREEKKDDGDNTALIDPKRVMDVEIGLARMKLSEDQLLEAILRMDDQTLPPEQVRKLVAYVPNDGELKIVREYVKNGGDVSKLQKAELFFVKMMDLVDIKSRLNLWLFKSEFPANIENIRRRINLVNSAVEELVSNNALRDVFTILLAIGNYMNSGTNKGNAYGFHLEPTLGILEGMSTMQKGTTDKFSLMMFVVKQCLQCKPDCMEWVPQLEILPVASKVMMNNLQQDVDAIRREMDEIDKKHKVQKRTLTQTHIDWARDGAAVPLNQIASHIRVCSRTMDPELLKEEFQTYKTLRAPMKAGMGAPGKIGGIGGMAVGGGGGPGHYKNDSIASVADDSEVDVENMFGKLMLQFYKRANATVRELETNLKQLSQNVKKLCQYFGADESTRCEEILGIFNQFRDSFIKATNEWNGMAQKQKKKDNFGANQNKLESGLANRPAKAEILGKYAAQDMDQVVGGGNSGGKPAAGSSGGGAGGAKASKLYGRYLEKKKNQAKKG